MGRLRIGILGAAHIAPAAIISPAQRLDGVEVVAVAARDRSRAEAFAAAHGIPAVAPSYGALIDREDLDAVYIAAPAVVHAEWAALAIRAGKHVLCEKPLTTSAADTAELVALAGAEGRVLCEALHYRYHPMAARMIELSASAVLGEIVHIEATHVNRVPLTWPVYWDRELGGGTSLHTGCYAAHCLRAIAGTEPSVHRAQARWENGVDAWLRAEVELAGGGTGVIESSLVHDGDPSNALVVRGSEAELRATNFIVPHYGLALPGFLASVRVVTNDGDVLVDEAFGGPDTYWCQLAAFADAVSAGAALPTGGEDAVANARLLEAMLQAAAA
jgi:predicted dehydrogenase